MAELKLSSGEWNEDLIRKSFLSKDASMILIKSGYHLAFSSLSNPGTSGLNPVESWWKYLWRMKIPPKWWPFGDDFRKANEFAPSNAGVSCSVPNSWRPPKLGFFKANSGIALDLLKGNVGVGIIIGDHVGGVLASCSQPIDAALCPAVAETTAILRGFIFAREAGLLPYANMAAHGLVKFGLSLVDALFRMEETPGCVTPVILGECPDQL
ncbi:hypothetical protein Dsin_018523 [Dipteronia sinensis]|uniref:RNase H type-1 domain-containing protein n=1 Tax=Dipteronia sinensis TaxID=43782 RepID=A0AAE0E1N9_9ROSI|nr:hypothetical protein Dsin_018523 [Dipteronia sinensis]